jgi:hypothetical protein
MIPISNLVSCLSPWNLIFKSCFQNQDDYEDNIGVERLVSRTLLGYKMVEYNLVINICSYCMKICGRLKVLGVQISQIVGH